MEHGYDAHNHKFLETLKSSAVIIFWTKCTCVGILKQKKIFGQKICPQVLTC